MPSPLCSNEQFISLIKKLGSPSLVAKELGTGTRAVIARRDRLQNILRINLPTRNSQRDKNVVKTYGKAYPALHHVQTKNSVWAVISDLHIIPGYESTVQRAFLRFLENEPCQGIILNGDIFEFAQISRHPIIGLATHCTVAEEIEAVGDWIKEVEKRAKGKTKIRTPGNHCLRLEGFVSNRVEQLRDIPGSRLSYYLPNWDAAWAVRFNGRELHVTHRMGTAKNAAYLAAKESMMSVALGHLHCQKSQPHTGMDVTVWGVDCGVAAEPGIEEDWPQFEYTEGRSRDWRAGWGVFTFIDGKLMPPELATQIGKDKVWFRGTLI